MAEGYSVSLDYNWCDLPEKSNVDFLGGFLLLRIGRTGFELISGAAKQELMTCENQMPESRRRGQNDNRKQDK